MDDQPTIEFEEISQERTFEAIRKSFRVNVEKNIIKTVLENKTYMVVDICPEGISFLCEKNQIFTTEQEIENCELIIPGSTIENLTAKIVHMTASGHNNWRVGIEWMGLEDNDLKIIASLVSDLKKRLLSKGRDDVDGQASTK